MSAIVGLKEIEARDITVNITNAGEEDPSHTIYKKYMVFRGVDPYQDLLNMPGIDKLEKERGEIHISELRNALSRLKHIANPRKISVRGTLYPAVLMSSGWWESEGKTKETHFDKKDDGLQEWLFNGFDLWGPSWDYMWNLNESNSLSPHPFYLAQLGDGDEANSLPVVIPKEKAIKLREVFLENWGGVEVRIDGMLGHRSQFSKDLENANHIGGLLDYCIWMDGGNKEHRITPFKSPSALIYSGYLWKCVMPKKWKVEGKIPQLNDVYFLWEHTNFANPDAVKYNLDSLSHKEQYLEKKHGELILLQKSSSIVPGKPDWSAKEIYDLLAGKIAESI